MRLVLVGLGLCLVSSVSLAHDVYKCQDAGGGVHYSQTSCASNARMLPYSKLTADHYEYQRHQAIQVRNFKAQRYAERKRYYQAERASQRVK
ncbi:DUF4124 domain-containing protein [Aquirhabdus parva]|uniref:DUF4124 domain-containing protein n=1 Tax=Aquirhabdus parva TaxID=2283318 RepID=A0A345P8K2_9GAMM|nr:DUF4124 domain-containing protein [Aquirhabdus parva]AXI03611.1 DUF4124 domain-containing protein [Aquirhabdus parva]